eukprot:3737867-Prymnesium_polylepis.1
MTTASLSCNLTNRGALCVGLKCFRVQLYRSKITTLYGFVLRYSVARARRAAQSSDRTADHRLPYIVEKRHSHKRRDERGAGTGARQWPHSRVERRLCAARAPGVLHPDHAPPPSKTDTHFT